MLNEEYKQAKQSFGVITSLPERESAAESPKKRSKKIKRIAASRSMESTNSPNRPLGKHIAPDTKVGLKLTAAERILILNDLMCLDDNYPNVIRDTPVDQPVEFTLDDWDDFSGYIAAEANHTKDKRLGKRLDAIFDKIQKILDTHTDEEPPKILKIEDARKPKASSTTVYQFKITLREITPSIWRRIQVKDCTLDKLHKHIQTAMGWANSHLHQFEIDGVLYGDPELLCEDWEDDASLVNSLGTKLSEVIPGNGERFRFNYEYDFGDGWVHEILFEGCLEAKKGNRYPSCIEGKRACPPEDVGGPYGYQEYLAAIGDPKHEEYETYMEWRGALDSEKFDAGSTTKHMRRGLPNG